MPEAQNQEEVEGTNEGSAPQWVKDLRKANKELSKQVESLSPLKQENLLLRAGVDLDAPQTELFRNGWKGDWNDSTAVAEAVTKYQLPAAKGQAASESETDDGEAAAHQRVSQASGGAHQSGNRQAVDYSKATSAEEVMAMARTAGTLSVEDISEWG